MGWSTKKKLLKTIFIISDDERSILTIEQKTFMKRHSIKEMQSN